MRTDSLFQNSTFFSFSESTFSEQDDTCPDSVINTSTEHGFNIKHEIEVASDKISDRMIEEIKEQISIKED